MITTTSTIKTGAVYEDWSYGNRGRTLRVEALETQVIDHPDGAVYRETAVCRVLTAPTSRPSAPTDYLVRIGVTRLQSESHYRPAKGTR